MQFTKPRKKQRPQREGDHWTRETSAREVDFQRVYSELELSRETRTCPSLQLHKVPPARPAENGEATRKCRCAGAGGQISGVLPGPRRLLPAEDGETRQQVVPVPAAEQADAPRLLRARGEGAALRYVPLASSGALLRMLQVSVAAANDARRLDPFIPVGNALLRG